MANITMHVSLWMEKVMKVLFISLIFFLFSVQGEEQKYYRWIDEKGTTHYSDTPAPKDFNADITIMPSNGPRYQAMTEPEPEQKIKNNLTVKNKSNEFEQKASQIMLISPQNNDTIRHNQGNFAVEISSDKPLGKKQQIRILLDGKVLTSKHGNSFILRNIDRGSHKIKAQLIDNGEVIDSTKLITIFLHRAIIAKSKKIK